MGRAIWRCRCPIIPVAKSSRLIFNLLPFTARHGARSMSSSASAKGLQPVMRRHGMPYRDEKSTKTAREDAFAPVTLLVVLGSVPLPAGSCAQVCGV
jgi:hypothetical protein